MEFSCRVYRESVINRESIIFFKYRRVERRWVWWRVSFVNFSKKVDEKVK